MRSRAVQPRGTSEMQWPLSALKMPLTRAASAPTHTQGAEVLCSPLLCSGDSCCHALETLTICRPLTAGFVADLTVMTFMQKTILHAITDRSFETCNSIGKGCLRATPGPIQACSAKAIFTL